MKDSTRIEVNVGPKRYLSDDGGTSWYATAQPNAGLAMDSPVPLALGLPPKVSICTVAVCGDETALPSKAGNLQMKPYMSVRTPSAAACARVQSSPDPTQQRDSMCTLVRLARERRRPSNFEAAEP